MKATRTVGAVGLSIAVLALAGCGDDDKGGGAENAKASGGSELTGPPIKVLVSAPVNAAAYATPEVLDTVQAGVDGINRRGGINGSPVELSTCDNGNDPNKAAQCAQQAVREGAVAMIGSYALLGGS